MRVTSIAVYFFFINTWFELWEIKVIWSSLPAVVIIKDQCINGIWYLNALFFVNNSTPIRVSLVWSS